MKGAVRQRRFPIEPLWRLTLATSAPELAAAIGATSRSVLRWTADGGITERAADRAAVELGLHPVLVWPDF